ncbi:Aste57867_20615 [Aphanomyces stellatus]|uniref:Aste57867_20615 protein n=1 Tax=Aphanomyces stellatus TaxID=120398 RepID=A0A485LFA5_9STRA|nr:hypothetical protein As57867_020547 [Aphanomyces stellatus]VFT97295.1 Aste57867_20615 [Aphanomyces stellatus]
MMAPSADLSPPPSRFCSTPLRSSQQRELRRLGRSLLQQAILECETSLHEMDVHWKYTRTYHGLKLYKAKSALAPADFMATGVVPASVSEIMQCLYADKTQDARMNSALLMPKDHLDCEVLHAMDTQDAAHPYRFNGLKWAATQWHSGALRKTRDLCYFESTGMTQSKDDTLDGASYGYCFIESVDCAQCPPLDAFSIVRAKLSIRHIFRELPTGGTVVMTHATVDPAGGSMSSWMHNIQMPPHLVAIAHAADVAESIRLSTLLAQQPVAAQHVVAGREWGRLSFLLQRRPPTCALCGHPSKQLLHRRRVVEFQGHGTKTCRKLFCSMCVAATPLPPPTLSMDADDCQPSRTSESATDELSRSSLRLSGYASDASSEDEADGDNDEHFTLEMDDEVDELVYTELDFHNEAINDMASATNSCRGGDLRSSLCGQSDVSCCESEMMCCLLHNSSTISAELARLTTQMDHVWGLVRRNKTQADFLKSHGRIEYLST